MSERAMVTGPPPPARRYEPLLKIASGGTASVWVGAAAGALGFRQLVAIKRPHEHLAGDPAFVAAFVEEAKIASRLRHANAVDVRDVEADESGVQLVMDWVEGASLSDLIRAWQKEPPARAHAVAIRIVLDACEGLRALHELADDNGAPLGCVHRDVSPANVLVGLDGVGRITDFGLARPLLAVERTTSQGALRGKLGYMAPEYIRGKDIDHRVDVFAMGIVLWEALARKRLYRGENDAETLDRVQREDAPKLVDVASDVGSAAASLDALLLRALTKDPALRIASIAELTTDLDRIAREHDIVATHAEVRESFGAVLRASLEERRREVQRALAAQPGADGSPLSASVSVSGQRALPTSRPPPSNSAADATGTRPHTPDALRSHAPPADSTQGATAAAAATLARQRSNSTLRTAVAVIGGIVLIAGTFGTALALRSTNHGAIARATPNVIDSDVQQRADETRSRASASSSSSGRAGRPHHSAAAPATSHGADPGNKAPRPNPYGSAPRP